MGAPRRSQLSFQDTSLSYESAVTLTAEGTEGSDGGGEGGGGVTGGEGGRGGDEGGEGSAGGDLAAATPLVASIQAWYEETRV
jgi:hypothetical protein